RLLEPLGPERIGEVVRRAKEEEDGLVGTRRLAFEDFVRQLDECPRGREDDQQGDEYSAFAQHPRDDSTSGGLRRRSYAGCRGAWPLTEAAAARCARRRSTTRRSRSPGRCAAMR